MTVSKPDEKLTRRRLLETGAGAVAGVLAATPAAHALRRAAERPDLLPVSADVWAASIPVTGVPPAGTLAVDGTPVAASRSGAGFTATLPLTYGENGAQVSVPDGHTAGQTYTARRRAAPTARIRATTAGGGLCLDSGESTSDPYTGAAFNAIDWSLDGAPVLTGASLSLPGPLSDGEHYLSCTVTDTNGRSDTASVVVTVAGGEPSIPGTGWQPAWIEQAIVYGVIPPLFGTPPLQAVAAALDRLATLGITALWLSPIFATVPGDFGYAVTDHFTVRPDYGDLETLQQLVAEAHERGLRVILDMPLNDTSSSHPYFQQAKRFKQAESRYWDFYERDTNGKPVHYFSWRKLPNLSYENEEVRRLVLEAAGYWLREADVDGFRCDAAWGVAERSPGFWAQWCNEVRRIRPDALLIAEAPARDPQYASEGFTSGYDWGSNLGEPAWQQAFGPHGPDLTALRAAISTMDALRPLRFLENNDTASRFITRNGLGVTRAALALLLSLPGLPCIYTGEEIGAEYLPYKQTKPLEWSNDPYSLEQLTTELLERRHAHPALQTGTLQILPAQPAASVIAYAASLPDESILVAVNFSGQALTVQIAQTAKEELAVALGPFSWTQILL